MILFYPCPEITDSVRVWLYFGREKQQYSFHIIVGV